jgi:Rrf2 family protein
MKIGNKADYALHAMLYIAAFYGKRLCTINEISASEGIPREYLAKILKQLTESGFLRSTKGIYGGYKLAKSPDSITFLNLIESFGGPVYLSFCTMPDHKRDGSHKKGKCGAHQFWEEMQKKIKADLAGVNLGAFDYKKFYDTNKSGHKAEFRRVHANY